MTPTPKRTPAGGRAKAQILLLLRHRFGADEVVTEHRFHPRRMWRFDYAVPALKLAVEYQGHGQTGRRAHVGGHASVGGLAGDCEKYNTAQAMGWRVIKVTALHFTVGSRGRHKLSSFSETLDLFAP